MIAKKKKTRDGMNSCFKKCTIKKRLAMEENKKSLNFLRDSNSNSMVEEENNSVNDSACGLGQQLNSFNIHEEEEKKANE